MGLQSCGCMKREKRKGGIIETTFDKYAKEKWFVNKNLIIFCLTIVTNLVLYRSHRAISLPPHHIIS